MNKTVKRILFFVILAILLAVFLYSAYRLGTYILESVLTEKDYKKISDLHNDHTVPRPSITQSVVTTPGDPAATTGPAETTLPPETTPEFVTVVHPETGEEMKILPEFEELFLKNTDTVGWIAIPGTVIDYPVVQSPKYPDYYLHRDFNKKYNLHGCIYAREQCDVNAPSDNITIYGHRMNDGSMFNNLINYTKESFYENNRYIYFDTLTERHTYEIFAVFKTTATIGEGFQYHHFVDADSEESFNRFVSTCKRKSFYDTGITPQFGDKMITLSTCEYSQENGRLVVVAVRVA